MPRLTASLLDRSSATVQGIADDFTRVPGNLPDIVRTTADTVTGSSGTAYAKAMAIQKYLRSAEFTYSLQSPVQGGYDGNGLSVLADFLAQKADTASTTPRRWQSWPGLKAFPAGSPSATPPDG